MKAARTNRREFLIAAGLGGAGAAAALVAGRHVTEGKEKVADAAPQLRGYRLTAHISKYYKTTEV
jgi:hypothetical protein